MATKMLVNTADPEEYRVAVVEDGRIEEIFIEPAQSEHNVGNIYKGRIDNIEPSFQAAFVDCGFKRNGFLHASDVNSEYVKNRRSGGKQGSQRSHPRLEKSLKRNQELVVQVTKSGIGTKGPALTTYLSLPGRFLVLMPNIKRHGVSRKIEDDSQRQKLRKILSELETPANMGIIIRTAGEGRTKRELQRDVNYLMRLYNTLQKRIKKSKSPALVYQETDLVTRVVRDYFSPSIGEIVVDSDKVHKKVKDFVKAVMPRYASRVKLYEKDEPLFHSFGIEKDLGSIYGRRVELDGGGYIVIDQTEALVAIDINSGSFTRHRNPEQSAYELNMLAAREVARQLRLRDLGGVIIIDFVDMEDAGHRRAVEKALADALRRDKARCRMLRMSEFGIVELTRQRMRPSVERTLFKECPHCMGKGHVRTAESAALDALRQLPLILADDTVAAVDVRTAPEVAQHINNLKRRSISDIEERFSKRVTVTPVVDASVEKIEMIATDANGATISTKKK
jgi:ribonuclease E